MSSTTTTKVTKKRARNYGAPKSARILFKRARVTPNAIRFNRNGPFPNKAIVTMRYVEGVVSSGAAMDYVFNLNSIFDPNQTGTGHQPLGRDQWIVFYQRYRVLTVRYSITAAIDPTVATSPHRITIVPDNQSSAYTDAANAAEQHGARSAIMTTAAAKTLYGTINLWELTGVTKAAYLADDRYGSLNNTSPAETICLHVVHNLLSGASPAANAMRMHVRLEFVTQLYDPLTLASS